MMVYAFLIALVMHIIADYMLQTDLMAKAKQRKWWKDNYPDPMYRFDWFIILALHSFEWSFCVMLPAVVCKIMQCGHSTDLVALTLVLLGFNTMIHMFVDNLKANKLAISLLEDQAWHFAQIVVTFIIFWLG